MSHLVVRKDEKGMYRIYNKKTDAFEGKSMSDKSQAEKVTETRDKREDLAMKK